MGEDIRRRHLLVEFKRPSEIIGRDAEAQALKYRDGLNTVIHNKKIEIMVMGGRVDQNISSHNERDDVRFLSYIDVIANARTQLNWLLKELSTE